MVDELKARQELITLLDRMRESALTAAPVEIDFGQLAETITNTEFDHPFMIVDGRVVDVNEMSIKPGESYRPTVYAPSVYHDDETDIMIDGDGWEAISHGMTGQYGYSGPVMHASEYVGAGIAETLAEYEPGTIFVMCVVEVISDRDEEPAGWVILRKDAS